MKRTSAVFSFALALCVWSGAPVQGHAQTVSTVPVGFMTLNVAAGTGTSSKLSVLSFPLRSDAEGAGRITGVTADSITDASATWTAGAFSQAATPYCIRITSGVAVGRSFLLSTATPNTATTITLDAVDASQVDLAALGIVTGATNGDTYEIVPCDTISSIFGTPVTGNVQGGATAEAADQVRLLLPGTGWQSYYYNTTSGWVTVGPTPVVSADVAIRPDGGVYYLRLGATPLELVLIGRVPNTPWQATVANTGTTVLSNNWPVDVKLADSKIRDLSGWVSAGSYQIADTVRIYTTQDGWRDFYHNGTNWIRVGPPINSDNVLIPQGSVVTIVKKGSVAGQSTLTQPLPYSL
jgi:uncharacterized protein (TIGR02597 family)